MVDHKTNIRLINTHPKRYCGNDHLNIFHKELILCICSNLRLETCVIR